MVTRRALGFVLLQQGQANSDALKYFPTCPILEPNPETAHRLPLASRINASGSEKANTFVNSMAKSSVKLADTVNNAQTKLEKARAWRHVINRGEPRDRRTC